MESRRPRIPRLVDGVDLRALPLSPTEGFVLSRIDGSATVQDLSDLTNLDAEHVESTIAKLIEHGAVEWADGAMGLPRTSLRPQTPSEPLLRIPIPSPPRPPLVVPHVTESEPPHGTREPSARGAPVERPAAYVETIEATSKMSAARRDGGSHASAGTARVGLRGPERGPTDSSPDRAPTGAGKPEKAPEKPASDKPIERRPSERPGAGQNVSPPPAAQSGSGPPKPAEGAEIDLAPERRARIDELFPKLDLLDHYEVLGLPRDADVKVIRSTYFELSKVFHPDTAFRKNLGVYKSRMEGIFKRLTEAYEVLGKKKSRAEYDAYLGLQTATRAVEAAIAPEPRPPSVPPRAASPTPPPAAPAPPSAPPAAPPIESRATMSEEGKRRARELLEKRLASGRGAATASTPTPPPASVQSSGARPRQEVLRDLTSSLKGAATLTGGVEGIQRHLLEARRAEQGGDLAGAARELRLAAALAPERADVAAELARVARALAVQLADSYRQQAEYEERHKKWAAAALSWAKVCEGKPDDAAAHQRAAAALVEAKGDLHKAQRFAARACDLAPTDPVARRTLGRVFAAAGLGLNARRELEKAAAMDPSDPITKNLLRDLAG